MMIQPKSKSKSKVKRRGSKMVIADYPEKEGVFRQNYTANSMGENITNIMVDN